MAGTYAGNAIACAAANATFAPWSCMELYGAVWSCMELFCHGILISIISSILHHLHRRYRRLDVMMAPNFMETVAARGEHLSEAQCDVATGSARFKGQDFVCWSLL